MSDMQNGNPLNQNNSLPNEGENNLPQEGASYASPLENPYISGPAQQPKSKKKIWSILGTVLAVLIVILGILFKLGVLSDLFTSKPSKDEVKSTARQIMEADLKREGLSDFLSKDLQNKIEDEYATCYTDKVYDDISADSLKKFVSNNNSVSDSMGHYYGKNDEELKKQEDANKECADQVGKKFEEDMEKEVEQSQAQ